MTSSNDGQYFAYPSQSGNLRHVDDSECEESGSSNIPFYYPPRNPQSTSDTLQYSPISPPTYYNPYQIHNQQPLQNPTHPYFQGGTSVPPPPAGYLPTPAATHINQSSSAFYSHLPHSVYQSENHQGGHHSSHYQNPPSFDTQHDSHYPINMSYYSYTPLPTTSRPYRPPIAATPTASLTDGPSAADQGTPFPGSMGDINAPSSSAQGRVPRATTEMEPPAEEGRDPRFIPHQAPTLRRPRSTPNVSNISNSQLLTPSSPRMSLTPHSTPSPSPSVVVSFAQEHSSSLSHVMTEDKSLTQDELQTFFPPSSRINFPSLSGSIQNSKWTCQWKNCNERVRSQDRIAHALEHYGKKRFTCSCGHTFARSQDKKRHLREQAICDACQLRPVGRNGKDGRCPSCRSLSSFK